MGSNCPLGTYFVQYGVGENGKEEFLKSPRVILILGQSKWVWIVTEEI